MSKKTWVILAIVIIAVGAVVGIALSRNLSGPSDSTPQSEKAPDFTLPTMTGANITLSGLEGTPLVLNFWSIPCSYCRLQLPYLEDVAQQSEGKIEVIAVNIVDTSASLQKFFGAYEPAMIIALDINGETFVDYCQKYGNPGKIPFTLFVDSQGIVKYWQVGAFANETALWDTLHNFFGTAIP
jgi:thiol-disulfide isomerase/thioredoxin